MAKGEEGRSGQRRTERDKVLAWDSSSIHMCFERVGSRDLSDLCDILQIVVELATSYDW